MPFPNENRHSTSITVLTQLTTCLLQNSPEHWISVALRVFMAGIAADLTEDLTNHLENGVSSIILRMRRAIEGCPNSDDYDCLRRLGKAYGWELDIQQWLQGRQFQVAPHVHLHTLPIGPWNDFGSSAPEAMTSRMLEIVRILDKYTPDDQRPILVVSDSCTLITGTTTSHLTQYFLLYDGDPEIHSNGCPPNAKMISLADLHDGRVDALLLTGMASDDPMERIHSLESKVKPGGIVLSCCISPASDPVSIDKLFRHRNGGEVYIAPPGVFWWYREPSEEDEITT